MLVSVTYEVVFKVQAPTEPQEVVCVTGDCAELGNWDPNKAITLRREGNKNVWSKKMTFTNLREKLRYRYFLAQLFQPEDHEEEKCTIVTQWETNKHPRTINVRDYGKNTDQNHIATFGEYDNLKHISPGWLIEQSQINIRLHGNPIKMWNTKYRNQMFSIKCTPIDHRYRDEHMDEDGETLPQAANTVVNVSVLEKGRSLPRPQSQYGAIYTPNCYMNFMVQTLEPENTGFQLDFYVNEASEGDKEIPARHVGYAFILPLTMERTSDSKIVPITSLHHKPLGQIKFEYLLVKPMVTHKCNMEVSYQHYWKHTRQPLDIGHRGMGSSYSINKKTLATVPENTVHSLMQAANHGADFVEFDVHLTKDKQVIVYHDFKVKITYRKKRHGDLELLEIPVKDLKLSELSEMKLWHKPRPDNLAEINSDDHDPEELQAFPTLESCLKAVDEHTGFNIEIKFPQELQNRTHEQEGYYDLNMFLDTILGVVFKHSGSRRIIFSTFDCDTCIALRLKQNKYPVLFLTQADTKAYELYDDQRTRSVITATEFCIAHGLLGVNAMSELLLKDLSLISYVKESGLVLFCWGEDNNNTDVINKLKQLRVDAIIYDRIDCFKTSGKESIFKMEHREKLKALRDQYAEHTIDMHSGPHGSKEYDCLRACSSSSGSMNSESDYESVKTSSGSDLAESVKCESPEGVNISNKNGVIVEQGFKDEKSNGSESEKILRGTKGVTATNSANKTNEKKCNGEKGSKAEEAINEQDVKFI